MHLESQIECSQWGLLGKKPSCVGWNACWVAVMGNPHSIPSEFYSNLHKPNCSHIHDGGCVKFLGLPWQTIRQDGLKQQTFILSQFGRLKVWNQGIGRATPSPRALGKDLILPLPASGDTRSSLACGCITHSLLQLAQGPLLPTCISVVKVPSS